MAEPSPVKYSKLPGAGISRKGSQLIAATRTGVRMWLGDDHLLQVESVGGYSETYKRFYFRDIQAFCLRKTKAWFAANVVLGFLTGMFLLWALTVHDSAGVIALGIFTGVFGMFLLLSVVRGPTCTVHLKTAVHYEELASLRRLRNANKVLARIRPLIEAAQGTAPAETLAQQYASVLTTAQATPAAPGQVTRVIDPTLSHYDSKVHQILFTVLLAMMVADVFYIMLPSVATVLLNSLVTLGVAAAVVIALVKQNNTDLKPAVRVVTWITAGYVAVSYFVGYITMFFLVPQDKLDGTQWGHVKALAEIHPLESKGWLITFLASATISGVLGLAGLLLLRQHNREQNGISDGPAPTPLP
jgi:hypothetical protein